MATGQARLAGRFPPGTVVKLVEVDGEHVLRSEGGREVDVQEVDKDGTVSFSKDVKAGGRYFAVGYVNGQPLEVRLRGNADDSDSINAQAPVGRDRMRLSDGSWLDEPPAQHQDTAPVGTVPGQHQVPKGTVQRSDTPRGTAHPVDVDDPEPLRRQEDVKDGTVQMSDTETGEAAEIVVGPQRQEDVPKGVIQRSDTPTGVPTVIPGPDGVKARQLQESSFARETRGDWTRAAAEPIDAKGIRTGAVKGASEKQSADRDAELKKSEREAPTAVPLSEPEGVDVDTSGRDAEGQPVSEDVARAAGVESADKPAEPIRRKSSSKSTKANRKKG